MASNDPKKTKMIPNSLQMAQDSPNIAQEAQDSPKTAPRQPQDSPDGPKTFHDDPKIAPGFPPDRSNFHRFSILGYKAYLQNYTRTPTPGRKTHVHQHNWPISLCPQMVPTCSLHARFFCSGRFWTLSRRPKFVEKQGDLNISA